MLFEGQEDSVGLVRGWARCGRTGSPVRRTRRPTGGGSDRWRGCRALLARDSRSCSARRSRFGAGAGRERPAGTGPARPIRRTLPVDWPRARSLRRLARVRRAVAGNTGHTHQEADVAHGLAERQRGHGGSGPTSVFEAYRAGGTQDQLPGGVEVHGAVGEDRCPPVAQVPASLGFVRIFVVQYDVLRVPALFAQQGVGLALAQHLPGDPIADRPGSPLGCGVRRVTVVMLRDETAASDRPPPPSIEGLGCTIHRRLQ